MDPVQKAVINHTFGMAQPKKKPIISCNICHLRFNSTVSQTFVSFQATVKSGYSNSLCWWKGEKVHVYFLQNVIISHSETYFNIMSSLVIHFISSEASNLLLCRFS